MIFNSAEYREAMLMQIVANDANANQQENS